VSPRRAGLLIAVAGLAAWSLGCASTPPAERDDYLRYVGFRGRGGEMMLLRWLDGQMPLAVHLPRPPDGMFENPDAIWDSVRDGVTDWTDVASPGTPSFRFVDAPGDADIRVEWAPEPDGSWYVAFCSYNANVVTRTFAVEKILVSARWPNGNVADLHDVYAVMLHEMGHALGLGGHSPTKGDVMFPSVGARALSERDRNTLRALYAVGNGRTLVGARRDRPY